MSMAAIFELHCCQRLFVMGRYKGNSGSSGAYACRVACSKCSVSKDPTGRATASFVTYVDDANLKSRDVSKRILTQKESEYVRKTVTECDLRRVRIADESDKKQASA